MSDLAFALPRPGFTLLQSFTRKGGFQPDIRYGTPSVATAAEPQPPAAEEPEPEPEHDPIALAYTQGFAAGHEQAMAEAAARAAADEAAREGLSLAITRLDGVLEEELRLRLRDTVAALCEAAIAPLAIDEEALLRRIAKAVSMLARADDERLIRLHPDDIALLSGKLREEWTVEGDASLERGTIRIESREGGVEDGPAIWRRAIAEALHQC